jgi:hypothetical protein
MLNSAREMPFFLDKSWQVWAANRRPPKADQRAISTSSRPARVRRPPASGEEARQMSLRTPAIRRDRPTVRGSPALRARSTSAGLVPAELSAKNHPCDAKDHARPRKVFKVSQRSRAGGDAGSARDAARLCSFADQLPLVLGKRGEDAEHELAVRGRRVDPHALAGL